MGDGREILATALLLLLASPLLGMGTLLALRHAALPSLRQILLTNLLLTAVTATAVTALSVYVEQRSEAEWHGTKLRVVAWTIPGANAAAPAWWTVTLSVAIDRLNRGPLCWLAWGAWAAGLITSGKSPESTGRYVGLLCLEAAWLWTYAAGDGVVFLGALCLSGVSMAMLTAWWGREDRRAAAARLWRWWLMADGLLLLGLLGLANAAVWSQQHLTEVLPAYSMSWEVLAQKLPRTAMHNQSAAQYWTASAGWWLWPLVVAAAIRSGIPPFHSAVVQWWGQVSAPTGVLTVLGGMPVGWYLWMRLLAPTFVTELQENSEFFDGWGALATLGAGMLCLAQTEVRKFAAWFSLAGAGLAWFLLASGPGSAWDAGVTAAIGGAALLALVVLMDDRWPNGRSVAWGDLWQASPRWSAAVLVTLGGLVGFPALARGSLDWQLAWKLAGARPGPFFVAMTGWFIAGWAAVWMMQRWLWNPVPVAVDERGPPFGTEMLPPRTVWSAVDDLRWAECLAFLVLWILMGLIATGWLTAALDITPEITQSSTDGRAVFAAVPLIGAWVR